MSNVIIGGTAPGATPIPVANTIDPVNDYIPIYTASATATQGINRNTYLGLGSAPVGLTDTQTLTNKILTSPTISNPTFSGTLSGTYIIGGTPTFPSSVVTLTGTQTLTNKILTSPTITSPAITNATISADAINGFTTSTSINLAGISITGSAIQSSSAIGAGIILPNALLTGTGTSWAWQSFTPTFTNLTLGTGGAAATVLAKYIQIGKTVTFQVVVVFGSGTVMGTAPAFSLPVTASSDFAVNQMFGTGTSNHAGSGYLSFGYLNSTSVCRFVTTGTAPVIANISASVPFSWTTGDFIQLTGSYEAA